jgi:hypothetical protein
MGASSRRWASASAVRRQGTWRSSPSPARPGTAGTTSRGPGRLAASDRRGGPRRRGHRPRQPAWDPASRSRSVGSPCSATPKAGWRAAGRSPSAGAVSPRRSSSPNRLAQAQGAVVRYDVGLNEASLGLGRRHGSPSGALAGHSSRGGRRARPASRAAILRRLAGGDSWRLRPAPTGPACAATTRSSPAGVSTNGGRGPGRRWGRDASPSTRNGGSCSRPATGERSGSSDTSGSPARPGFSSSAAIPRRRSISWTR